MTTLCVALGERGYDVLLAPGLRQRAGQVLASRLPGVKTWMIITDEHVDALYGQQVEDSLRAAGLKAARMAVPPGEASKSLAMLETVYHGLCTAGISRADGILALGGGVVGDLAGFAAATYLRGIPYVQAPTSLLAQVDSAVGGKVAVDLPEGKNLVGSFYQPRLALLDPDTLDTLPDRYFTDGMGEVIKYGCIKDAALFDLLLQTPGRAALLPRMGEIIERCVAIKARIVEMDERDTGERMLLNFGHTLGHAIEAAQGYAGLSHGEAVAAGMHLICRLGEEKGLTKPGTAQRLADCLIAHGLPLTAKLPEGKSLYKALHQDKKRMGQTLKIVLLSDIGDARLHDTTPDFFAGVETWM